MTCPVDSEQLDNYLDGESEPKLTAWFDDHLKECSQCLHRVEFHRHLKKLVSQSFQGEVTPEPMRLRLLQALEGVPGAGTVRALPSTTSSRAAWYRQSWVRPLVAAASLAVVSLGAFLSFGKTQPHPVALAMASDHTRCFSIPPKPVFGGKGSAIDLSRSQLGQAPEVASFPALSQYDARICPIQGQSALHVLYNDAQNNQGVSMFSLPESSNFGESLPEAASAIHPAMYQTPDKNLAAWKRHGWVYSLVAEMPSDQLQRLAEQGSYSGTAMLPATVALEQGVPAPPAAFPPPGQPSLSSEPVFGAPVEPVVWTGR